MRHGAAERLTPGALQHLWDRQMLQCHVADTVRRRNDLSIARSESGKKMRIGEGSTGVVYKAFMHGDEVAVKIVRAANPGRKELLVFKKEVRLLAMLSSCEHGMLGGILYIALPPRRSRLQWRAPAARSQC